MAVLHSRGPSASSGYGVVSEAIAILEGLGLCVFVSRLAVDVSAARRIAGMMIAGGTALALLNVSRLFEVALRRGPLTETLGEAMRTLRINTQFSDLNAAGSYLALMAVAAVGLSNLRTRRGVIYAVAALPLVFAVWLTGSRTALVATGLGSIGMLVVRHREGAWRVIVARKRLIAVTTSLMLVVLGAAVMYPSGRNVSVRYSIWARAQLVATALDMLADRPLLGVGVSRFYDLFRNTLRPNCDRSSSNLHSFPLSARTRTTIFCRSWPSSASLASRPSFWFFCWHCSQPQRHQAACVRH